MVQHANRQEELTKEIDQPRVEESTRPLAVEFDDLDEETRKAFDWAWTRNEAALRYLADR